MRTRGLEPLRLARRRIDGVEEISNLSEEPRFERTLSKIEQAILRSDIGKDEIQMFVLRQEGFGIGDFSRRSSHQARRLFQGRLPPLPSKSAASHLENHIGRLVELSGRRISRTEHRQCAGIGEIRLCEKGDDRVGLIVREVGPAKTVVERRVDSGSKASISCTTGKTCFSRPTLDKKSARATKRSEP